jgi:hypothetical protein
MHGITCSNTVKNGLCSLQQHKTKQPAKQQGSASAVDCHQAELELNVRAHLQQLQLN